MPHVAMSCHHVLTQVGFYAGHIPSVAVYDYEIARELFSRDVAAGRPNTFVWMYRCVKNADIVRDYNA